MEIPPHIRLGGHFTTGKAPEIGYVLSGSLTLTVDNVSHTVTAGDSIYLSREMPQAWENNGPGPARLLWVSIL